MSEDLNLQTKLSSTADTSGAKSMGDSLSEIGTKAVDLKAQVEALMASFAALFALTELISFFKDAVAEAEHYETTLRQLALAADNFNQNSEAVTKRLKEAADGFVTLGIAGSESLPMMGKFYQISGDVENSVKLMTLAIGIHLNAISGTGGGYSLEEAYSKVNAAAHGMGRAVKDLLPIYVTQGDKFVDAEEILKQLHARYGDVTKMQGTLRSELEKSNATWKEVKRSMGDDLLPITSKLVIYFHALGPSFVAFVNSMIASFGMMWNGLTHLSAAGALLVTGHLEEAKAAWAAFQKSQADGAAKITAINEKAALDIKKVVGEIKAALAVPGGDDVPTPLGTPGKVKKALKEIGETLLEHLDSEHEVVVKAERLREAEAIARKDRAVGRFAQEAADKLKIEKQFAAFLKQIGQENLKESDHQYGLELASFKKLKQQELDLEVSVVNGGLELIGDAFGIKKELAIAEATINAAQAILTALDAPYPLDIVLPILIGLQAAEQIAQISSTSSPSMPGISATTLSGAGFDNPANDQAAYMGGRKWANDMIGKFSGGASSVSQGWAGGMGGSTTNNNSSSHVTHINVSGGLLNPSDRESMKQFGRKLAIAMQSDSQRTIARRT